MPGKRFTFYTTEEYWHDLPQRIERVPRGGRVAITVMDLNTDIPLMRTVFDTLLAAAKRGVEVWLCVDAHTFMFNHVTRSLSPYWATNDMQRLPSALAAKLALLEQLNAYPSGHAIVINKPPRALSNPIAGRSHIKATVIDDYVYVGGCNFQRPEWVDIMAGRQDNVAADYVFEFVSSVGARGSTSAVLRGDDRIVQLDTNTKLFIDAGKPGQSAILEQALTLIDAAEQSIFMTCQYFPNSVTARHLKAAYARGVSIELIYAHPDMQGTVGSIGQHLNILIERTRVPAVLFKGALPAKGPGLHAKLLATDKGTMLGSHNYVRAGVKLGTAEMAICSIDPAFGEQTVATLRRELSTAQV